MSICFRQLLDCIQYYLGGAPASNTKGLLVIPPAPHAPPAGMGAHFPVGSHELNFYDDTTANGYLGNFHPVRVETGLGRFQCAEAAFQAEKDPSYAIYLCMADGPKAFRIGQDIRKVPHNWIAGGENINSMRRVLRAKFDQNPHLKTQLVSTGRAYLNEHNPQIGRDRFWSDNNDGSGLNMLGKLLMELRGSYGGVGEVSRPSASAVGRTHQLRQSMALTRPLCAECRQLEVYIGGGKVHPFCGRGCASAYGQKHQTPLTHPICALCDRKVTVELDRYHPFCSKAHAAQWKSQST